MKEVHTEETLLRWLEDALKVIRANVERIDTRGDGQDQRITTLEVQMQALQKNRNNAQIRRHQISLAVITSLIALITAALTLIFGR